MVEELKSINEKKIKNEYNIEMSIKFFIKINKNKKIQCIYINKLNKIIILYNNKLYEFLIKEKILKKNKQIPKKIKIEYIFSSKNKNILIIIDNNLNIYTFDFENLYFFINFKFQNFPNNNLYINDNASYLILINDTNIYFIFKIKQTQINLNFYYIENNVIKISLENEKKNILPQNGKIFYEGFEIISGNNYYLGSFIKIYYIFLVKFNNISINKIFLIEYYFLLEKENKNNFLLDSINNTFEFKKYFKTRYSYSYILPNFEYNDNINKNILIKSNYSGKCIAILVFNSILILFYTETYKFIKINLKSLYYNNILEKYLIENIIWLSLNDIFLLIFFSNNTFILFDIITLNIIKINKSNTYNLFTLTDDYIYGFNYLYTSSKLYIDYNYVNKNQLDLLLYNKNIITLITFDFEKFNNNIIDINNKLNSFNNFLYNLHNIQNNFFIDEEEYSIIYEKINNFMFSYYDTIYSISNNKNLIKININKETDLTNVLIQEENDMNTSLIAQDEHIADAIKLFVDFIKILKSLNEYHYNDFSILNLLIIIANDFFFFLLFLREIWLSYIFLIICEKYLLESLQLKFNKNEQFDQEAIKNKIIFFIFNPHFINNNALKCYNNMTNCCLFSKLRVYLFFYSLIEFRNNQALNINVLYFVLAKKIISELKSKNLLDDINILLKVIINNWKFLKEENVKIGKEEYQLNSLIINKLKNLLNFGKETKNKKFNFLNNIYTEKELCSLNDINYNYICNNYENIENLYINNFENLENKSGIIQKWNIYFDSYFYEDLFEEIRNYYNKNNIDVEVNFNVNFFVLQIQIFLIKILDNLNFKYTNFSQNISITDIPYIIFEFLKTYEIKIININSHEINSYLYQLIIKYIKETDDKFIESFEFCEFLLSKGILYKHKDNNIYNYEKYIFVILITILLLSIKTNSISLIEKYINLIIKSIKMINPLINRDILTCYILVIKGYLKYYNIIQKNELQSILEQLIYIYKQIEIYILNEQDKEMDYLSILMFYDLHILKIKESIFENCLYNQYKILKNRYLNYDVILNLNQKKNNKNKIINEIFNEFNCLKFILSLILEKFDNFEKIYYLIDFDSKNIINKNINCYLLKTIYIFFYNYLKDIIISFNERNDILYYYSLFISLCKTKENYLEKRNKILDLTEKDEKEFKDKLKINLKYNNLLFNIDYSNEIKIEEKSINSRKLKNLYILLNNEQFSKVFIKFYIEFIDNIKSETNIIDKIIEINKNGINNLKNYSNSLNNLFGFSNNSVLNYNNNFEEDFKTNLFYRIINSLSTKKDEITELNKFSEFSNYNYNNIYLDRQKEEFEKYKTNKIKILNQTFSKKKRYLYAQTKYHKNNNKNELKIIKYPINIKKNIRFLKNTILYLFLKILKEKLLHILNNNKNINFYKINKDKIENLNYNKNYVYKNEKELKINNYIKKLNIIKINKNNINEKKKLNFSFKELNNKINRQEIKNFLIDKCNIINNKINIINKKKENL